MIFETYVQGAYKIYVTIEILMDLMLAGVAENILFRP